ncbi:hypothetical protein TNCV_313261 [Trichonephila clavipes]|nr:hypothetical protein TNCV_313261 [Trichonephila clavipes]
MKSLTEYWVSSIESLRSTGIYRELKKIAPLPNLLTGLSPTEDVKAAHPKDPTTALSTSFKANHPRLRDGCSGQRVT